MVPATMLPPAIAVVRSTTDLMKTKLLPQKTATLKSSTSATSALRPNMMPRLTVSPAWLTAPYCGL